MAKGKKTGGRAKGTPNKITGLAREVIAGAAEDLGGRDRLVQWAKSTPDNEGVFWSRIYPRLVPVQLSGDASDPLVVKVVRFGADNA